MSVKLVKTPLSGDIAGTLYCGDSILLTGYIYTARDAAHARLTESIKRGEQLPFEIKNSVIYYVGPTPAMPGKVIGSAGPTTSSRMDVYTPALIACGLTGMIGKGKRSREVTKAICKYGAVYFGAIGGAGAMLAQCIESSEIIAYEDLGAEAIRLLKVNEMPLTVVIDSNGNDLYKQGRENYLTWRQTIDRS